MNNDTISRSALLEEFEWLRMTVGSGSVSDIDDAIERIKKAPAVDAEPVRHGYWIDMQEDDLTEGMWRCSACDSDMYFDIMTPTECGCYYCPNCGAKMDAEVEG